MTATRGRRSGNFPADSNVDGDGDGGGGVAEGGGAGDAVSGGGAVGGGDAEDGGGGGAEGGDGGDAVIDFSCILPSQGSLGQIGSRSRCTWSRRLIC